MSELQTRYSVASFNRRNHLIKLLRYWRISKCRHSLALFVPRTQLLPLLKVGQPSADDVSNSKKMWLQTYLVAHASRTGTEYSNYRKPVNDAVHSRPITNTGCSMPKAASDHEVEVYAVPPWLHEHVLQPASEGSKLAKVSSQTIEKGDIVKLELCTANWLAAILISKRNEYDWPTT